MCVSSHWGGERERDEWGQHHSARLTFKGPDRKVVVVDGCDVVVGVGKGGEKQMFLMTNAIVMQLNTRKLDTFPPQKISKSCFTQSPLI